MRIKILFGWLEFVINNYRRESIIKFGINVNYNKFFKFQKV